MEEFCVLTLDCTKTVLCLQMGREKFHHILYIGAWITVWTTQGGWEDDLPAGAVVDVYHCMGYTLWLEWVSITVWAARSWLERRPACHCCGGCQRASQAAAAAVAGPRTQYRQHTGSTPAGYSQGTRTHTDTCDTVYYRHLNIKGLSYFWNKKQLQNIYKLFSWLS